MVSIKIRKEDVAMFREAFHYVAQQSQRISDRLDSFELEDKDYIFENSKWGIEMSLLSGEYQLVLELKEVKDE